MILWHDNIPQIPMKMLMNAELEFSSLEKEDEEL